MKKGIFFNSVRAQCSIYESGLMCYNALKASSKYTLDYTEDRFIPDNSYDFALFNEHITVNNWMNEENLGGFNGVKFGIVLEVGKLLSNLMPLTKRCFDKYMIIDPTIKDHNNIYGFPRPIESVELEQYVDSNVPVVGSFGFATPGKVWRETVVLTNHYFNEAIVRINIPFADYVPNCKREIDSIKTELESIQVKPGINLEFTSNYMEKEELIKWCAKNTLNYFPYYRDQDGLAAVTDQAISSGRPLLVTQNTTFRHILEYTKPYPQIGFIDAIEQNLEGVLRMQNDWSIAEFYKKFETIL